MADTFDDSSRDFGEIDTFAATLLQAPERFSIINLSTNEEVVVAQYNPTEFDDELSADYERLGPVGASSQRIHFKNTNNYSVALDLFFAAMTEVEYTAITQSRQLLRSWLYPRASSEATPSKGPPRLLATWPNVFSIECYLLRLKVQYQRFAPDGRCTRFIASIALEESRTTRLTSEAVARASVVRGGR